MSAGPRVSVVIEGFNESKDLGTALETLEAIERQDYPLDEVEVLLVGSVEQCEAWTNTLAGGAEQRRVRFVAVDGGGYYELKNTGAAAAAGQIIAFADSDVVPDPGWLRALVEAIDGGADFTAGLTTYRDLGDRVTPAAIRLVAASISWGFVTGGVRRPAPGRTRGFLGHNLGVRGDVYRSHPYRTDFGRTCGTDLLFNTYQRHGRNGSLVESQRVAHSFTPSSWLFRFHFRIGYEEYRMRRIDTADPNMWLAKLGFLEPVAAWAVGVISDFPRWLRFSRKLGYGRPRRWGLLPLVLVMSIAARGAGAAAMAATIASPKRMERWAQSL
jgi:glycosyltransferase involved in cell wall biosynthesis